jgi:hypothetical protein
MSSAMSLEVKAPDAVPTAETQDEQVEQHINGDIDADAEHEVDDPADSKPKKKRRIIKTPDKKFNCPNPECGKAYSRAEHLYRHQLNRMSRARDSPSPIRGPNEVLTICRYTKANISMRLPGL